MRKLSTFAVLTTSILSGCAGYKIVPPKEHKFNNSIVVAMSRDEAWSKVIEWYANNNAPIDKLNKESGLVTSYSVIPPVGSLDCGQIEGNWSAGIGIPKAQFNTILIHQDDDTKVKFNLFGEATASQLLPGGSRMEVTVRCVSTGALETAFSNFLNR